jgi:hypothetical protein
VALVVDLDVDPGGVGDLVQHCGDPAARGITERPRARRRREEVTDEAVERGAVALDQTVEEQVASSGEDGRAVITQHPVHEDDVAGPCVRDRQMDASRDDADARGGQEELVARAALHDLRVARDDFDSSLTRGLCHRARDPAEELEGYPLFEDGGARQVEGYGAAYGEVVDRTAHGKLSDVSAGKEQRVDDERVGREGEAIASTREGGQVEASLVLEWRECRVVEGADENVVDEVLHRLATTAMGECDGFDVHPAKATGGDGLRASDDGLMHGSGCHADAWRLVRLSPPYW